MGFFKRTHVPILFMSTILGGIFMSNVQPEVLKTLRSNTLNKINLGKRRTHTFNVDFSDIDSEFVGKFTLHYPSQIERLQIGVTKSALLGGNVNVDTRTDDIAHIIATLDIVSDVIPQWFDVNDDRISYEILETIFIEYMNWVDSFRKRPEPSNSTGDSQDTRSQVSVVDTKDVPSSANG